MTRALTPVCSLLLVVGFVVSQAAAAPGGNWPQWRGPNRDGKSSETGLNQNWEQKPPKLLWTTEGLGEGYAGVSIADGKIFTTGNVGEHQGVLCLSESDGRLLWNEPVTDKKPKHSYEGSRSTPTLDGDRLYVVTSDGQIACLKQADGKVVWQKEFQKEWEGKMMSGWGFSESPLIDGDLVLCTPGGKDAMIVALDKMSGETKWKCAASDLGSKGKDGAGYSSIAISNAGGVKQYVQLVGRGVIGVRASDGKLLWHYNPVANDTANIPTPIPVDDYVFCSSGYGTGAALIKLVKDGDAFKVEEQYFLDGKTLQNHHGGMIMIGDYVYLGHGHNKGLPVCVKWKTGEVVWRGKEREIGDGSSCVTFADGNLIYRFQSGPLGLVEASPEGYKLKGTFKPEFKDKDSWAHPVVAGGKLYLREQNKLMCYDLKP